MQSKAVCKWWITLCPLLPPRPSIQPCPVSCPTEDRTTLTFPWTGQDRTDTLVLLFLARTVKTKIIRKNYIALTLSNALSTLTTHKSWQGVNEQLALFKLLSRLNELDLCGLYKQNNSLGQVVIQYKKIHTNPACLGVRAIWMNWVVDWYPVNFRGSIGYGQTERCEMW